MTARVLDRFEIAPSEMIDIERDTNVSGGDQKQASGPVRWLVDVHESILRGVDRTPGGESVNSRRPRGRQSEVSCTAEIVIRKRSGDGQCNRTATFRLGNLDEADGLGDSGPVQIWWVRSPGSEGSSLTFCGSDRE